MNNKRTLSFTDGALLGEKQIEIIVKISDTMDRHTPDLYNKVPMTSCMDHYETLYEKVLRVVCTKNNITIPDSAKASHYRTILDKYEAAMESYPKDSKAKREAFKSILEETGNNLQEFLVEKNKAIEPEQIKSILQENLPIHSVHQLNWILEKINIVVDKVI